MISKRDMYFGVGGLFIGYALNKNLFTSNNSLQMSNANTNENMVSDNARIMLFFHNFIATNMDANGRCHFLDEILKWDETIENGPWERTHNFIQWIFPTHQPSAYERNAPLLLQTNIENLINDPLFLDRYAECLIKFMNFMHISLTLNNNNVNIKVTSNFYNKTTHNFLRLSRLIISLKCLGFHDISNILYNALIVNIESKKDSIQQSARFWRHFASADDIWSVSNKLDDVSSFLTPIKPLIIYSSKSLLHETLCSKLVN